MPTTAPDDTRDPRTRAAVETYGTGGASVTDVNRVSVAFTSGTFTAGSVVREERAAC